MGMCLALGMKLSFRWICAGGPDMVGKGDSLLKAVSENCSINHCLSLGTFCSFGGNGVVFERIGSFGGCLVGSKQCAVGFSLGFGWVFSFILLIMGCGYSCDNMFRLTQASLLRYSLSIPLSLQMYRASFVVLSPIANLTGTQPLQTNLNPPTAVAVLLHLMRLLSFSPISFKCLGPPMEIVAPLSGNTLIAMSFGVGMF